MKIVYKGGKGSGNFGHQGRPGLVGGSGSGTGAGISVVRKDFLQIEVVTSSSDAQSALADAMGESEYSPELGELVNEELAKWLADKEVRIRVPSDVLLHNIVSDGRLKNQFETGTSGGTLSIEARSNTELELMDIPKDANPTDRPVYGYLMDGDGPDQTAYFYGDATLVLKSDVRDRTTFCVDDSLDNLEMSYDSLDFAYAAVSWMNKPSWASGINTRAGVVEYNGYPAIKSTARILGDISTNTYIEAQIHGGVSLKDIAKIYISGAGKSMAHFDSILTVLRTALPDIVIEGYAVPKPVWPPSFLVSP